MPHLTIEQRLGAHRTTGRRNGLATLVEGDSGGIVAQLPSDPMPVSMGVFGPAPLSQMPQSFMIASRALETAVALGRVGVHDIRGLGLLPAVMADPVVGDAIHERFIAPLIARGETGETILDTVERYLAMRGQLGDTAAALYVHPNTVRYRIGRFEALTECSLQDVEDLVEVWWALQLRRLQGNERDTAT